MGLLKRLLGRDRRQLWETRMRWLHRLGYVTPPVAVQWIMTSACDLECPHCYSHAGRAMTNELKTQEAMTLLLDELVKLDKPNLVLAGGEPLLRPDFAQIIERAHRLGIPWSLHTHGGWIDRHLDVFRRFPPLMVAVSLDGPNRYHDTFRGKAGSFEEAMRAIALLKQAGVKEVVAGTTVTRGNADLINDMLPMVMDSGADSWGLHLMTPEGRAEDNHHMLATPAQLRRVAVFARQMRTVFHIELDNEWGSAGEDDWFYRDDPYICGAGRFSCVVSATGELMPCTTTDASESAGNIRIKPLSQLWAEGFGRFRQRKDLLRGEVDDCWLQTRHGRSCRAAAFRMDLFDRRLELDDPLPGACSAPENVPLTIGGVG